VVETVLDCSSEIYRPDSVEFPLSIYDADYAITELFKKPFEERPESLKVEHCEIQNLSDTPVSDISNEISRSGVSESERPYIAELEFKSGQTRVTLADGKWWIDSGDEDHYKTHDYVRETTESAFAEPLELVIKHWRVHSDVDVDIDEETWFEITFWTYTDLWFEDSTFGEYNRQRLAEVFECIESELDVVFTDFSSESYGKSVLSERDHLRPLALEPWRGRS